MVPTVLVPDVLRQITSYFRDDYGQLYTLALVNHELHELCLEWLYCKLCIHLPLIKRPVLDLRNRTGPLALRSGLFSSACLPHHSVYVKHLAITGYFLGIRGVDLFMRNLLDAFPLFSNLESISLTPTTFNDGIFDALLPVVVDYASVRRLLLNSSCQTEANAKLLFGMKRPLSDISIRDPKRVLLNDLVPWLQNISASLRALHLFDNCGSITPGVLRSFIPSMANVTSFALGVSYSLAHDDVFAFLNELPQLTVLQLHYYFQYRRGNLVVKLPNLKVFTATHFPLPYKSEADDFCVWIRRIISKANAFESLKMVSDKRDILLSAGANVSYDSIIRHLCAKHANSLKHLTMDSEFVSGMAFILLCRTCVHMEEFVVAVNSKTLRSFPKLSISMGRLRSAGFIIRNVRHRRLLQFVEDVPDLFRKCHDPVHFLSINNQWYWKRSWIRDSQDDTEPCWQAQVKKVTPKVLPWYRE